MIVKVIPMFTTDDGTKYEVAVIQGVQHFRIYEEYSRSNCLWIAGMFRKALRAHNRSHDRARKA